MMMGNHWMSCTFTTQEIGKWVVTHSKVASNLRGHCLAIYRKQCPLWILFMSQHLGNAVHVVRHAVQPFVCWQLREP